MNEMTEKDGKIHLLKQRIREKINELRTYQAKVGVFGVTGVGKSSLCNALFGEDVTAVSDVAACTREPQELFIGNSDNTGGGIYLIDVPGVGETTERDDEYFKLYKSLMPELDLVIWVIKADDRAYSVAERAYKEILMPYAETCPTIFVINQVDKMNPIFNWDRENNQPGSEQQGNISKKVNEISAAFDVSAKYITACSVEAKYNLISVMDTIVEYLPKEKKFAFVREAKEEVVTEETLKKAERGIWDTIKEFAGEAWDNVQDFVANTLVDTATAFGKKILNSIASFKFW